MKTRDIPIVRSVYALRANKPQSGI